MSIHPLAPGAEHALRVAQTHALSVPAYRRLLTEHGIDPADLTTPEAFTALPTTSKADYRHAHDLSDLLAGTPELIETISASAGSSGTPTWWPRGTSTLEHCVAMLGSCLRDNAQTHRRPTLVLVTFPLGPYVGGTLIYATLLELRRRGHRITIATPGMDVAAITETLAAAGALYEQIVILAYPPIARDVLDHARDHLGGRDVKIIVGGEPVSESWRARAHAMLGDPDDDRVRVLYGATDVGFVGYETAGTVAIRRAASVDPVLNASLFAVPPDHGLLVHQPAFVQYDPDATYVEVMDGYLLFTVDGVLPLIRYRVNDRGEALTGVQVRQRLTDGGRRDLAGAVGEDEMFLIVHGRTDVAAIFNAANIYPDYLRPAVEHISLATRLTGRFVIRVLADEEQRQTLFIDAELRQGHTPDAETATHLQQLAIASLRQMSAEYRIVHDQRGADAEPVIALRAFKSPGFEATGKQQSIQDS